MDSEDEQKLKLVKRYSRLAIVSAFLLALLWPLDSFFFWIFSGATAYFAFLAFYFRPRVEREEEKFEYTRPAWQAPEQDQDRPLNVSPKNVKLIVVISVLAFFGFLLILMIIGFATGDDSTPEQISEEITINESRDLLAEDPTNIDALTNLGNSFYENGQYDSAMAYYERVLKIDSKNSSGLYNKGLVHYQKKEYQKSMDILRQCIFLYPDNTEAIMVLGDNYYSQDQFIPALDWYKQAYNKGARTAALSNVMAYIYDQQNQKGEAIRFYKEALQQDSSLVDVYARLAELDPNDSDWYKEKAQAWK